MRGLELLGGALEHLAGGDLLKPERRADLACPALGQIEPGRGEDVLDEALELGEVDADLAERSGSARRVALGGQIERDADAR